MKSQAIFRTSSSCSEQAQSAQPQHAQHSQQARSKPPAEAYVQSFLSDLCFWENDNCNKQHPHQAFVDSRCQPPRKALSQNSFLERHGSFCTTSSHGAQSFDQICLQQDLRWQAAVDPATGRTYYYDTVTLKTQWNKPPEFRQWEKQVRRERRRQDKFFFREMEQNMYSSIQRGELVPGLAPHQVLLRHQEPLRSERHPAARVRTLSGMDDQVLSSSLCTSLGSTLGSSTETDKHGNAIGAKEETSPSKSHVRHSTCGGGNETTSTRNKSFWSDSTIINPNVAATIQCVCGIYRAQIQLAHEKRSHLQPLHISSNVLSLFQDDLHHATPSWNISSQKLPSLEEIVKFYTECYETSLMHEDTIIMSLIYLERLGERGLNPTSDNWRSLLFSCMILASKVWDDFSCWNVDFHHASAALLHGNFSLRRINDLEVAVLTCLQFDVRVTDSVYAKYYFRLRTLMIRSGLQLEKSKHQIQPLQNLSGNRKMQHSKSTVADSYKLTISQHPSSDTIHSPASIPSVANSRRSKSEDWNVVLSSIYSAAAAGTSQSVRMIPGYTQTLSDIVTCTSTVAAY